MTKKFNLNNNNTGGQPQPGPTPNISLSNTERVESNDGNLVFGIGVILRKASKFLAGTDEDSIIPVQVFYDIKTGRPLLDMLPEDLRKEYEEFYKNSE